MKDDSSGNPPAPDGLDGLDGLRGRSGPAGPAPGYPAGPAPGYPAGPAPGYPAGPAPEYVVVIPTIGRPCLQDCLDALAAARGPRPAQVVVVDDRRDTAEPLPLREPEALAGRTVVVTLEGRGPAAARNAGWRAARPTPWVVFLDDDVRVGPCWREELAGDLAGLTAGVGGVQGVIDVPLPAGRRPTDWERGTAGLAGARWITADMAYRRAALAETGGFDERFPRAFREDADLALRVRDGVGFELRRGRRRTTHPVRPSGPWASVRAQAGNGDDVLMTRLHGRDWPRRAEAPPGRRPAHLLTCLLGAGALVAGATGHRRTAAAAAAGWLAATAEFAAARIAPGPRTAREMAVMAATSVAIPPVAVGHWLHGLWRWRRPAPWLPAAAAVLFDRDGTLVRDVPYNGRPDLVRPMPGAAESLARLRAAGLRTGVVTNQSGVGRGLISEDQLRAVNERVEALLGPFDTWAVCPHDPSAGCDCRKPAPGLITTAAGALGLDPADCVVVGDIGADAQAAHAAGARAIVVPTPVTLPEELEGVPVAPDLAAAVTAILDGHRPRAGRGQEVSARAARIFSA
ncbi:MAG TPA: HAD-IIIA family hydrolase [Streptosporangiaceae bacterium]|nr:HAD-IIIA family hydrolase [Streptosporangiaceae bacterium]